MNGFEKCLFDDISSKYAQKNLSAVDYEEIYYRFLDIDYLEEVKPYLYAMRFFWLGYCS